MTAAIRSASTVHDPWVTRGVTIKRFQRESPSVFTIHLSLDNQTHGEPFGFTPGQFNMLYVPGVGEAAISIAGVNANSMLLHTIKSVGSVTRAIEAAGVGMSLGLRGPFGKGWLEACGHNQTDNELPSRDLIIAAGGVGLAPLRSLIEFVKEHRSYYGSVTLLIGARMQEDLLYRESYSSWKAADIEVFCTVDRVSGDWKGRVGVITAILDGLPIPRPALTMVMTCGPEVMMRYVARSATMRGISEEDIWVSLERNMNCAIGLCGHCQLGPLFLCKDGPVFRFDVAKPWLMVQDL